MYLTQISCPGELEEAAAELEMSRRKLSTLRSQKEAGFVAPPTGGGAQHGGKNEVRERKSETDKISREARELEAALEEAKVQLMLDLAVFALHVCDILCKADSEKIVACHDCRTSPWCSLS